MRCSVGVRGEWMFASASSDIFDFVTEQLTLEKSSFDAPGFGMDLAINLTERLDLVTGFDYAKSTTPSEYRDFIDNQNLPIQQIAREAMIIVGRRAPAGAVSRTPNAPGFSRETSRCWRCTLPVFRNAALSAWLNHSARSFSGIWIVSSSATVASSRSSRLQRTVG